MPILDTNRFLFEHTGTLQSERLERAPSPQTMQVSGRSFNDLIKRSAEFAKDLVFYNDANEPDGDWQSFFTQVYDYENACVRTATLQQMMDTASVPPHLALMLAFFKLVLIEQDSINTLTDRQMAYYFEQVLGFRKRASVEGKVTVFAELNKNTKCVRIPKGTLFDAGKDAAGKTVAYESIDECVLGPEKVDSLLLSDNDAFRIVQTNLPEEACIFAFCLTSPILAHPVCRRKLTLLYKKGSSMPAILSGLQAQYSAPEGWQTLAFDGVSWTAEAEMPEMVPPIAAIHGLCPLSAYPVIRFVSPSGFKALVGLTSSDLTGIQMEIGDWTPETLSGKYGIVENKPGAVPFGSDNRKGDFFEFSLKHPASVSPVTTSPFDADVKFDKSDRTDPRSGVSVVRYSLSTNNNSQQELSNNYSSAILQWMKDPSTKALDAVVGGKLIAVIPKLSAPVTVQSATFSDAAPKCALLHCFGHEGHWDFDGSLAQYVLESSASSVYLALSNVGESTLQANLFFTLDEIESITPAMVRWDYFDGVFWHPFPKTALLKDTSSGLSRRGVCQFDLRDAVQASRCDGGVLWIRGTCNNKNAWKIYSVANQALELEFSSRSAGKGPGGEALLAGSVTKPVYSVAGLKSVLQTTEGQEGKRKENDTQFRARVSEHLRHKGRAWSLWDYESLILERFPQIVLARCLPAFSASGVVRPGDITILVIPQSALGNLRPEATAIQIADIKEMLSRIVSPFVNINVQSPSYKEIHISATLHLRPGFVDTALYESRTSASLCEYLRPWIGFSGSGQHFSVGNGASDIIAFLESLPYVDHVEVPVGILYDGRRIGLDDVIELPSPLFMITSSISHEITCKLAQ